MKDIKPFRIKKRHHPDLPPVILLGGGANALSIARSLGRRGVSVYALNEPTSHVRYSRFCRWIPLGPTEDVQKQWLDWLTGNGLESLRGAVVLPCADHGLELIARHRAVLQEHYTLIEANDQRLLDMLDKEKTYALGRQAGVPTPETWSARTREEVLKVLDKVTYPCALKPRHSHLFQKHFPFNKLFVIHDINELLRIFEKTYQLGLEMLITEIIPGSDDQHCSYYSYLDERGTPLFHFTKRKLRQNPNGFGFGTYHVTDWNPEVAEMGLRFLQGVGLRGIGNVEFKRDPRDGRLKLIECNARFTAGNEILILSGIDFPLFVYNRLTGRRLPSVNQYRAGVWLWLPLEDYWAFRNYRRRGELSTMQWLRSLCHRQHFAYFHWTDPWPTMVHAYRFLQDQVKKRFLIPFVKWLRHITGLAVGNL